MKGLGRSVVTLLGSLLISSCTTRLPLTPVPNWTRPICQSDLSLCTLCRPEVVAVTTPWDDAVRRIYERLWNVAKPDVPGKDVTIEVIESSAPLPLAGACKVRVMKGDMLLSRQARIWISAEALRKAWISPNPELTVARLIAHELGHVVLHHSMTSAPFATLDPTTEEDEADQLGTYYFERAGYDCREWVKGIGRWARVEYATEESYRAAVQAACDLAKEGRKPPRLLDPIRE